MASFEITINGSPYCPGDALSAVTLVAERRAAGDRLSIHARSALDDRLDVLGAHLRIGDEIVIRIVDDEVDRADGSRACSFCGREAIAVEVERLVTGAWAAICDACAAALGEAIKGQATLPSETAICTDPDRTCGFCARSPGEVPGLIVRGDAAICPECLRACTDLIQDVRPE